MKSPASTVPAASPRFAPFLLPAVILVLAGLLSWGDWKRSVALAAEQSALRADTALIRQEVETAVSGLRSEIGTQAAAQAGDRDRERKRLDELTAQVAGLRKELEAAEALRAAQQGELEKARAEIEASRQKVEKLVSALSALGGGRP